jgi:hypothetical protein
MASCRVAAERLSAPLVGDWYPMLPTASKADHRRAPDASTSSVDVTTAKGVVSVAMESATAQFLEMADPRAWASM